MPRSVNAVASRKKRKKILKLTTKGKQVVKTVNDYSNTRLKETFKSVGKENVEIIVKGLELINSALKESRRIK